MGSALKEKQSKSLSEKQMG